MDVTTVLITALGLILGGGTIGTLATAYFMRKKTSAEAESTLSAAILAYANKLTTDNDKLRKDMDGMDNDVIKLQEKLRKARSDLDTALEKTQKLQEIIVALETRKANDQIIISKLLQAIKIADPAHPLLIELQSILTMPQAPQ